MKSLWLSNSFYFESYIEIKEFQHFFAWNKSAFSCGHLTYCQGLLAVWRAQGKAQLSVWTSNGPFSFLPHENLLCIIFVVLWSLFGLHLRQTNVPALFWENFPDIDNKNWDYFFPRPNPTWSHWRRVQTFPACVTGSDHFVLVTPTVTSPSDTVKLLSYLTMGTPPWQVPSNNQF